MTAYFNIRVKDDLAVNTDNQELFTFSSYTFTEDPWDGVNAPQITDGRGGTENNCRPYSGGEWDADDQAGDGQFTATGWCNGRLHDDGADSFETTDLVDRPQHTGAWSGESPGTTGRCDGSDRGGGLAVDKVNVDGPATLPTTARRCSSNHAVGDRWRDRSAHECASDRHSGISLRVRPVRRLPRRRPVLTVRAERHVPVLRPIGRNRRCASCRSPRRLARH